MDTTKMMPEEMLAQFDAAFRVKFGCGIAEVAAAQDESGMAMMGAAMWAWQASREAVVVELPVHFKTMAGDVMWSADVREALEAQGLKVEVKP
ncbi:hypothetical protein [Pseudomonas sp. Marseille-QA0332]